VRRRLDQLERACGCEFGRGGRVRGARALRHRGPPFGSISPRTTFGRPVPIGFAVCVVGAGLGKTFGLIRARNQRNRLLDELYSRVATVDGSPSRALNANQNQHVFRAPDRAHD